MIRRIVRWLESETAENITALLVVMIWAFIS